MDYRTTLDGLSPADLTGFFVGWPNPPSPDTLYRILKRSYRFVLAVEDGQVVGVGQAISDGMLSAYVPLLEVRPEWQRRGVGLELMRRLLAELDGLYAIDLSCDDDVVGFYEKVGLRRANAMFVRNYAAQSGLPEGGL